MTATESTEATLFSLEIDGETKFLHMSQTALYQAGHFVGKSIMIYDDTKNYKLTEELRNLATSDPLTGLLNRRTFFERAEHDFDLARRDKRTGCAMMCDIDHFKKVNDTYGHACGDEVIINVTKYIANRLRHTDLCGRYGGEEFVLWLPSTPPANAEYVAESIRSGIESLEIKHDKYTIKITISIGIAPMKEGIPDKLDTVINNADFALYQAKNNGRNQVVMFDEPDADIQKLDEADYMVWGM
jgi:diguanylate cyclase (GGDEF)-like protein